MKRFIFVLQTLKPNYQLSKSLHNGKSDVELIQLYKSTSNTYYAGVVFQRYSHLITALSYKYLKNKADMEDAVMEVFEIMVRDLKSHEVKNFGNWLYSVTKNHCLKKKNKKEIPVGENGDQLKNESFFMEFDDEEDLNNRRLKEIRLEVLENAIKSLADEQKKCVELFYISEKSYKEIAGMTGFSENQVKSYIQNGKRNLKIYFEVNE
ncbi:MAG TPA: RNA polymerase subunit sigma-24 [Bacteroidales bacterium]|nr:RNA polymerase subunit sigma-24 [Bacteroidales bacterium]